MPKIKDMKKKGVYHFQTSFKTIKQSDSKAEGAEDGVVFGTRIAGYASTPSLDIYNDVVEPEAFRESIQKNYKKNPIILFQHQSDRPIGKATFMSIDTAGLYIEGVVVDKDIEPKIQAGILRTFSIGYIPQESEFRSAEGDLLDPEDAKDRNKIMYDEDVKRIIKKLDLVENSIVSVPANLDAQFDLKKSVKSYFDDVVKKDLLNPENALKYTKEDTKNNPTLMDERKNLLEEKEAEEAEETPVEKTEVEPEAEVEVPEETPVAETADKEEGVEKDAEEKPVETDGEKVEEAAEVAEEEAEEPAEEAPKEEAPAEEPVEEPAKEEEKSIVEKIMTKEGAEVAIKAIERLTCENEALQAKLDDANTKLGSTPEKQALAYKGEEAKEAKAGFKDALANAA